MHWAPTSMIPRSPCSPSIIPSIRSDGALPITDSRNYSATVGQKSEKFCEKSRNQPPAYMLCFPRVVYCFAAKPSTPPYWSHPCDPLDHSNFFCGFAGYRS